MTPPAPPILVTGSHRSGTTWAGQMLAAAPGTGYVHEPFNVDLRVGFAPGVFDRWFQYVCRDNEGPYRGAIEKVLSFRYPTLRNLARIRNGEDLRDFGRNQRDFLRFRRARATPIVKDPIAFYSAEWLCETFGMNALVLIRHPAAFCSSLKIKGWSYDFGNFLSQPLLMERYLHPFESHIAQCAQGRAGLVEQGIVLWNCVHHTLELYRQRHPEWTFVRHEDLSLDPVERFREIYERLGLTFTEHARSLIAQRTGSHNPVEQQSGNEYVRDSRRNVSNWKKRLSADEIAEIRDGTAAIYPRLYPDMPW